jgi:tRNA(Ile)-lysidine synthase
MPATRALSPSVAAVRPLLNVSRGEIESYLNSIGQTARQDETNLDPELAARNAIRHDLLPQITERFGASATAAILRVAEQAAEAQSLIDTLAAELLQRCQRHVERSASGEVVAITLAVAPLFDQTSLLASEALRLAWREAGWPEQAMTHDWWRCLTQFAQSPELAPSLNLPGDIHANRPDTGVLSLRRGTLS